MNALIPWFLVTVQICQTAPHDCPQDAHVEVVKQEPDWKTCQTDADAANGISTVGGGAFSDSVARSYYAYCRQLKVKP